MLAGTGKDQVHLLIAVTADRGLAGAFNSSIGRAARTRARALEAQGKTVKILAVGRKGRDYLRRELASRIAGDISYAGKRRIEYADAQELAERITTMLNAGEFDVATLIYNRFQSVISQVVTEQQLIPVPADKDAAGADASRRVAGVRAGRGNHPQPPVAAGAWRTDVYARCWKAPPASMARG